MVSLSERLLQDALHALGQLAGRTRDEWIAVEKSPLHSSDPQKGEQTGGVENRRRGVSLPVAHNPAFARVASVRLGVALFPVPAHRTEQARFAHSALGESVTRSPTES